MLKYTTRYYLLLFIDIWERTTLIAKFKLLVLIQNRIDISGKARIRVKMIADFGILKTYYIIKSKKKSYIELI